MITLKTASRSPVDIEKIVPILSSIDKKCFHKKDCVLNLSVREMSKNSSIVICAESEARVIIGYVLMSHTRQENSVRIIKLAVLPEFRGMGVGGKLLTACVETSRLRRATSVTLHVATFREPAIKLYKSAGFSTIDDLRDYYFEPGTDALLMKLDLH